MPHNSKWSHQEWSRAKDLLAREYSTANVAALRGRTQEQLRSKIRWESTPEHTKEERRAQINARRNASGEYKSTPRADKPSSMGAKCSADQLEQARLRLLAPRTISQQLMGDPPPGYSALDRKRQEGARV